MYGTGREEDMKEGNIEWNKKESDGMVKEGKCDGAS